MREYLVWRVYESAIDWFALRGSEYVRLKPDKSGVFRSEVFPGLRLDTAALVRGDLALVLTTLRQDLESSDHAELVSLLAADGD